MGGRGERGLARDGLLVASLTGALLLVVSLAPTASETAGPYRARLADLLTAGPGAGVWRTQGLWGERVVRLAPDPARADHLLLAEAAEPAVPGEAAEAPAGACRTRSISRRFAAHWASSAPADLFFANYEATGPATPDRLPDGTAVLRVRWTPKVDLGGDTSRTVWHDPRTHEVLATEDRSYGGHVVRSLVRVGADPGTLESPEACVEPKAGPARERSRGAGHRRTRPPSEAPFAVLAPDYLPPGYRQVKAEYVAPPGEEAEERPRTRLVNRTYSDGLGTISVAVAPREDMDRLEAFFSRMASRDRGPDACPTLPEEARELREGDLVIRRRTDRCRTVLRVDGLHDVSVVVMGQNEVPGDEYVKVVRSLRPVWEPEER